MTHDPDALEMVRRYDAVRNNCLHIANLPPDWPAPCFEALESVQMVPDIARQLASVLDDAMLAIKRLTPPAEARREVAREIVDEQAKDEGLWFQPRYISEAVLQKALRRLHEAIEGKSAKDCAIDTLRRAADMLEE